MKCYELLLSSSHACFSFLAYVSEAIKIQLTYEGLELGMIKLLGEENALQLRHVFDDERRALQVPACHIGGMLVAVFNNFERFFSFVESKVNRTFDPFESSGVRN